MRKRFPVLHNLGHRGEKEYIPWEVIAPHEAQAHKNHSQSLERLAARGGLSYREMYAMLRDKEYEFAVLRIVRDFYTKD